MNGKKTIMLIDDDADECTFFEIALAALNDPAEMIFHNDGAVALKRLKKSALSMPDLIFLDWNMPTPNGKECLVDLRSESSYSSVPIIIYTTSNSEKDKVEALELGASLFVSKPPGMEELMATLKNILELQWDNKA